MSRKPKADRAPQDAAPAEGAAPPAEAPAPQVKRPGPAFEVRYGRIKAVVWRNESAEHGTWFSVTVSRLYKDEKSGTFKTASSFGRDDLLVAAKALEEAWYWVMAQGHAPANNGNNGSATSAGEDIPF